MFCGCIPGWVMSLKLQSNPAAHIPLSEVGAIPPPSAYSMGSMGARAGVKDAKQPKAALKSQNFSREIARENRDLWVYVWHQQIIFSRSNSLLQI